MTHIKNGSITILHVISCNNNSKITHTHKPNFIKMLIIMLVLTFTHTHYHTASLYNMCSRIDYRRKGFNLFFYDFTTFFSVCLLRCPLTDAEKLINELMFTPPLQMIRQTMSNHLVYLIRFEL